MRKPVFLYEGHTQNRVAPYSMKTESEKTELKFVGGDFSANFYSFIKSAEKFVFLRIAKSERKSGTQRIKKNFPEVSLIY